MPNFANAEAAFQPFRRDHPHTVGWALFNNAKPARVIEEAAQGADGPTCHTRTPRRPPTATHPARTCRFASRNIGLEAFDVCEL